jgi:tetratricopeptide (TPR) repeat protein
LISFNRAQTLTNACKALEHAAFFGPGSAVVFDAVSLNISGDRHYQTGAYGAAMAEYRAALRLDPTNVNVHNSLGVCMAKINDLAAAKESFEAALKINPQEAMSLYNLGLISLQEASPDKALGWFQGAYRLDKKTFEIPFQIGKLLINQKQWGKAVPFLEKAIKIDSKRGPAFCLLGECLSALSHTNKAIASYKKAVKLNPNDASALSALGLLYDSKGENPEICLTFCRQSVHLSPQNGLFRKRLAHLYKKYEQFQAALTEYEKASALGHDCFQEIEALRNRMTADQQHKKRCA